MRQPFFFILSFISLFCIPHLKAADENKETSAARAELAPAEQISWYDIAPDIRKYIILMTAVSMELNAELPDGGTNPTTEQQIDMMQKIVELTPVDFLTGEARAYITEANQINTAIIEELRRELPKDRAGILAVRERYAPQIDALSDKYPAVSRYFTPKAQMSISFMILRELDIQRVMVQAAMAGKSQKEAMRTAAEHLRYEAEHQF